MSKVDQKIAERLKNLVAMGERVVGTIRETEHGWTFDPQLAAQWASSSRSLLGALFGREGAYFQDFDRHLQMPNTMGLRQGLGVIYAAQSDFEANGIFNVRRLVEAEVFADFLEQAEHLLERGFFQAAAVVTGCVLEDGLRKLCAKHSITLPENPKLDMMNADLAKKGVYDKMIQKRVTAEADVRNKAAHGEWEKFSHPDVEAMLTFVRRFLTDFGA